MLVELEVGAGVKQVGQGRLLPIPDDAAELLDLTGLWWVEVLASGGFRRRLTNTPGTTAFGPAVAG